MKNDKPETGDQNQGKGREQNVPNANQGQEDISKVDRQEGQMNNGELGGNLEEESRQSPDLGRQQ
ncbi:MAG: hypothetical protein ACJ75B_19310 [Flavisolibacter sp.]